MEADSQQLIEAFDRRVERRNERRDLFRMVLGTAVGAGAFAYASTAAAQATVTDPDILNFALNLEYLEAQFYAYAATGAGIAANLQTPGASAPAGGVAGRGSDPLQRDRPAARGDVHQRGHRLR